MDALVDALLKGGHIWGAVGLTVFLLVARWLAPRLDKLIDRHMAFLDALQQQTTTQSLNGQKLTDLLTEIRDTQKEHMDLCRTGAAPAK